MTLRIGFIGTGQIARWHLNGLADLNRQQGEGGEPLYELVALADPREEARMASDAPRFHAWYVGAVIKTGTFSLVARR